jgi:hypothetical protein
VAATNNKTHHNIQHRARPRPLQDNISYTLFSRKMFFAVLISGVLNLFMIWGQIHSLLPKVINQGNLLKRCWNLFKKYQIGHRAGVSHSV